MIKHPPMMNEFRKGCIYALSPYIYMFIATWLIYKVRPEADVFSNILIILLLPLCCYLVYWAMKRIIEYGVNKKYRKAVRKEEVAVENDERIAVRKQESASEHIVATMESKALVMEHEAMAQKNATTVEQVQSWADEFIDYELGIWRGNIYKAILCDGREVVVYSGFLDVDENGIVNEDYSQMFVESHMADGTMKHISPRIIDRVTRVIEASDDYLVQKIDDWNGDTYEAILDNDMEVVICAGSLDVGVGYGLSDDIVIAQTSDGNLFSIPSDKITKVKRVIIRDAVKSKIYYDTHKKMFDDWLASHQELREIDIEAHVNKWEGNIYEAELDDGTEVVVREGFLDVDEEGYVDYENSDIAVVVQTSDGKMECISTERILFVSQVIAPDNDVLEARVNEWDGDIYEVELKNGTAVVVCAGFLDVTVDYYSSDRFVIAQMPDGKMRYIASRRIKTITRIIPRDTSDVDILHKQQIIEN